MAKIAGKTGDRYVNVAYLDCLLSAANTLTFKKLDVITGALLGAKQYGILIERAEFIFTRASMMEMTTDGDFVEGAICLSSGLTNLSLMNPEILFNASVTRHDFGVAAAAQIVEKPLVRDFSNLSGGGILIPADRIFLGAQSTGLASAATISCRLYYTSLELAPSDYLELLQSRTLLST